MMPTRSRVASATAAVALLALLPAGCSRKPTSTPTPTPSASSQACADPVHGQKFGVCGHLTTAPTVDQGNVWVLNGAVDARTPTVAGQHNTVEEGTFHASH